MRTLIAIVMFAGVAALSAPATASEYTLGFFTDESASSCEIYNTNQEVITIHMILYGSEPTANTVAFRAPTPECWTDAVWLGDEITDPFLFLGSTHSEYGIVMTFTECRTLPLRLGSMSFWASGSETCCTYDAYPQLPVRLVDYIEVVECASPAYPNGRSVPADHESVIINPDASCSCTASSVVSTEPTTWGKVKALYR